MRLTYLRCFPVHGELEALLLGLEVLVQLARPVADHADVQAQLVGLLQGHTFLDLFEKSLRHVFIMNVLKISSLLVDEMIRL